jgi:hypothetical protein
MLILNWMDAWNSTSVYSRAGEPFWGCVLKFSTNFKEILLHSHGNFEEQNKVLESSISIINYCIIIINAYYVIMQV